MLLCLIAFKNSSKIFKNYCFYSRRRGITFCYHGPTPPSGVRPPLCWGFTITLRYTTVCKTPLDQWSARRRDLYLTTQNTHNRQTYIPTVGIRTRNPRKRVTADLRLRPRGHWDRLWNVLEVNLDKTEPFVTVLNFCPFSPSILKDQYYTGRFIMYSGITKIYYRKTAGHVFTKPVQIEGSTQFPPHSKLFFVVVPISAARRCECMY